MTKRRAWTPFSGLGYLSGVESVVPVIPSTEIKMVKIKSGLFSMAASMQRVAPGGVIVKSSLMEPDKIKVVPSAVQVDNRTILFTMPPLSVGVVRINP